MDIEAVLLKKEIGTNFYHSTFDDFESFDMEKACLVCILEQKRQQFQE